MKKIKEFLKKLCNKNSLLQISLFIGIGVHFYYFHNLITHPKGTSSWFDIINIFILIVTLSTVTLIAWWLLFYFMTKDALAVEKWALKNLTKVCYFIAMALSISFILKYLTTEQFLTSFWALVVFWYWYKKYERDKELELIRHYSEKYNILMDKINFKEANLDTNNLHSSLISLWFEEFFLHERWYISDELWSEWDDFILYDMVNIITRDLSNSKNVNSAVFGDLVIISRSPFLLVLMQYWWTWDNLWLKQKEFTWYMHSKLQKIYLYLETTWYKEPLKKEMLQWLCTYLESCI